MTDPDLRAAITEALADPDIDGTLAACPRGALVRLDVLDRRPKPWVEIDGDTATLHLEIDVEPALKALRAIKGPPQPGDRVQHLGVDATKLDETLRLAYTALQRTAYPDIHDRAWLHDYVMPTIRAALKLR